MSEISLNYSVEPAPSVHIQTSIAGNLWTVELWKVLIDALARKGSKSNPCHRYIDLAPFLQEYLSHIEGRYFLQGINNDSFGDDSKIRSIVIKKCTKGSERVRCAMARLEGASQCIGIEFHYFGTIGDSKYEEQSKANREKLKLELAERFERWNAQERPKALTLWFQLRDGKKDRDLDNLADALMPTISDKIKGIDMIRLVKLNCSKANNEQLYINCEPIDRTIL